MSVDLTKGATVELVKALSDDLRTKSDSTKWESAGAAIRAHDAEIANAKNALRDKYIGYRRYLTASDDCLALLPGVYMISSTAAAKPANIPSDFSTTGNGFIVVLESDNGVTKLAIAVQAYAKRIWFYSGYGWVEFANTNSVATAINDSIGLFADEITDEMLGMASGHYAPGTEITTTKTQYKYIDPTGVKDISTSYPDWYVTDELTVEPLTFYYVTGSARYANHYIFAVYDNSGKVLSYESADSSTIKTISNQMIFTPYGASKIRIASVDGENGAAIYPAQEKAIDKKWTGLKWAAMGDSLTAVNSRTTIHYHDYIADDTGVTVVNLGAGGTGYKQSYGGVSGFMDRVDTIPLDADVVTIFGGGNDNEYTIGDPSDTGTDTLCGCINTTIERIFARKVTCNIGIITPTPWQAYNPADSTNWMAQYSAAIVQICKNWGIPCLDLYHCSNLRPWEAAFRAVAYSKDDGNGVHPDETGHKLIAPKFEAFLNELLMH